VARLAGDPRSQEVDEGSPTGLQRGCGVGSLRILGIDPGSNKTGWGIVEDQNGDLRCLAAGVARAGQGEVSARLGRIGVRLEELLDKWGPDVVALERAFVGRNVHSALRLGEVRGVVLGTAGRRGLRVVDYPPATVKVAVAGAGAATKEMVARGVGALLGLEVEAGDATDALAVAICHLRHDRFAERLGEASEAVGRGRPVVRVGRRRA
jgi:crossover junction endodeoxyribonuclease RuvC